METVLRTKKAAARRLALARRAKLDPDERVAAAATIVDRLLGEPELAGDGPVCAFVSVREEVPTTALLRSILEAGRTLLLPYVADDGSMRAAPVRSLDELEPGYRGIPEPRSRFPVDPATADVIVAPGVAFDARGRRLGYGGGFYDRFLRAAPGTPRAGICFETQIVDEVPAGDLDELMDLVVTEERTLRPG